jgi:(1->4)-alpha-D-glucan 1-alpha-D-glucosylmutase
VPAPNHEYLIYQTLVGAWPIDAGRLTAYIAKAMREAKTSTSWLNPNERFDEAMARFTTGILDARRSREFVRDLGEFTARVAPWGWLNGLAQLLIKIATPGVPDFYQGTELWDDSLVDPDNRRPIDFDVRRRALEELRRRAEQDGLHVLARHLSGAMADGRVKMYVMRQALLFRRQHARLFLRGGYQPLEAAGDWAEHLCAFARVDAAACCVVVVPRFLARRGFAAGGHELPLGVEYWGNSRLPVPGAGGRQWHNVFTGVMVEADDALDGGGSLLAGRVLSDFPVALLEAR